MYKVFYVRVSAKAPAGASFIYAVARTFAQIESCGITGSSNLPDTPGECFITFKVKLRTEFVDAFEKLSRLKLLPMDSEEALELQITCLQDYLDLPYQIQVSQQGLDALREFSDTTEPLLQLSIDDSELVETTV